MWRGVFVVQNVPSIRFPTPVTHSKLDVRGRLAVHGCRLVGPAVNVAGEGAVPLSDHEQRLFDEIERSLAEDTKFASAVRSTDPRFHARRRIVLASIAVLLGLAVLVLGAASQNPLLGVAGFVIMLGAAALGIQAFRKGRQPELKVVGGKGTRRAPRSGGLFSRLEDRWHRRPEGDQNG